MKQILEFKRCYSLDDYNNLISELLKNPVIEKFIHSHKLYNREILDNECYVVKNKLKTTVVYLKCA